MSIAVGASMVMNCRAALPMIDFEISQLEQQEQQMAQAGSQAVGNQQAQQQLAQQEGQIEQAIEFLHMLRQTYVQMLQEFQKYVAEGIKSIFTNAYNQ